MRPAITVRPWVVAALWLSLGYANLVRGVAHPAVGYRPWAFAHHSYSDLLALSGDRYLGGGHPLPYLEDPVEYPVLLGLVLWAPSWLPGGQLAHFTASYLFLGACLFAALAVLRRMPGASPWWLAGTPALAYYAGLNWDLLPIFLLVLAVSLHEQGRAGASGAAAALGACAKLWPAAFLPAAAGALAGRDRRAAVRLAGNFAAAALCINLPVAVAAPRGWSWFFRYNASRGPENSVWEALGVSSPLALALAPLAVVAAAAAAAALAAARTPGPRAVRLGTALVLVAWMAANKVWSPQYALYGFAAGALAAPPRWLFWALSAVSIADYHLAFEVRSGRGLVNFFDGIYTAEGLVRTAAWGLFLAWIGRALWLAAAPRPARAAIGGGVSNPSTR